ncbi:MAG: PD-(D/E)XK nuclease family protein [Nanoarchaeota archaeon]|nr:PD-(D/E)XK nuclease family protein [Nanoarchaeota archaeon]MBU1854957.1 PD-(D/E)XK nuclease family protein [Nanoarchaeota archaeon]
MATYSHSRISTFEQCKLKFKYKYIDKIETDIKQTVEAFLGNLVHRTLQKLYSDLKFQKLNSKDDLIQLFNDLWKKEWSDEILIVREGLTQDNFIKMGEKFISDYYEHYKPFDEMKILGLETTDMMTLSDDSKYHVRIDKLGCVGTTYFIADYKTNSTMKDQAEADSDRQLAMYSIWVKNKYSDVSKVVLKWHMLAFDKEVTSERTDEELKKLQDETVVKIKVIETCADFSPKVSALCDWCEFKQLCPKWKHLYELEEKKPEQFREDDGVKLADEYAHLRTEEGEIKEKIEALKDKIFAFADFKGVDRVFGTDQKVTIWRKECDKFPKTTDYNYQAFVEMIKKLGLWNEFSRIDTFKLEKSFESKEFHGEIQEILSRFAKKEKIKRIYMGKK